MRASIVLVGEESVGLGLLNQLDAREADLRLVLSDGPVGRLASSLGYEVGPADLVSDPGCAGKLAGVDLLLNAHSTHIVADEVLAVPTLGAFNVHPGPLPEYAGLNTPCWAIYEGAASYGVTVHRMTSKIDAGAVAYERRWPLTGEETGLSLWSRCSEEAVGLLKQLLDRVEAGGEIPSRPQDLDRRRYYGRAPPGGGRLTWREDAGFIERIVRACEFGPFASPWGRPRARIEGLEVALISAVVGEESASVEPGTSESLGKDRHRVATADRWLEVKVRSSKTEGPA